MSLTEWIKKRANSQKNREKTNGKPDLTGYAKNKNDQGKLIDKGPLRHESLTPDQLRRVTRLQLVLAEAYPITLAEWIDDFLRGINPEYEIQMIEAIASVYEQIIAMTNLSLEEKRALYAVLCAISAGINSPDLANLLPQSKGMPAFAKIVEIYYETQA